MSAAAGHRPKYVAVLGACCTADAAKAKPNPAGEATVWRLLCYQDRTSWLSMATAGLRDDEFELAHAASAKTRTDWGVRMVLNEAKKQHLRILESEIAFADALLMDSVSTFIFPYLADAAGRSFVESWEWRKYIRPITPMRRFRLWDVPTERCLENGRAILERMYVRRPSLRTVYHVPQPSFSNGVTFDDPALRDQTDFFAKFNDLVANQFGRQFPNFSVVSPCGAEADANHQNGKHPFNYVPEYHRRLREQIEKLLV